MDWRVKAEKCGGLESEVERMVELRTTVHGRIIDWMVKVGG